MPGFVTTAMLAGAMVNALPRTPVDFPVADAMVALPGGALQRSADGLFYVTGTINGARVRFLIDTGSSTTVLTGADARRAGVMPSDAAFAAVADTANGPARVAWVNIDELNVGGVRTERIDAAVAPDGLGVSLLGQNWLSQLRSLTISGDRMEFR